MADPLPFDYMRQLDRRNRAQAANEQEPSVELTIRAVQADMLRQTVQDAPPPDRVARTTRVARDAKAPTIEVEGSEDRFEASLHASAMGKLAERYPAVGRFGRANPRGAAAARDDVSTLDKILRGFGDILTESLAGGEGVSGDVVRNAQSGAFRADAAKEEGFFDRAGSLLERGGASIDQGIYRSIAALTGSEKARQAARALDNTTGAAVAGQRTWDELKADPGVSSLGGYILDSGIESLPGMLAALVPYAGIGVLATSQSGNIAATRAQNNGRSEATASDLFKAAPFGIASAALERIGATSIIGSAGKSAFKRIAVAGGAEGLTEATQSGLEYTGGTAGTDAGFDITAAGEQMLAGGIAGAGIGAGLRSGGEVTIETSSRARALARDAVGSEIAIRAGERLRKVADAVSRSKLKARDPEAMRELLREQAAETGATEVYVPGEAIRAYQQSDGYDLDSDPFAGMDWDTANDVVMPIEDFLTDVVGTHAYDAISREVRMDPGGQSVTEAEAFNASVDGLMSDMEAALEAETRAERSKRSVREKLVDQVAGMFGQSYTSPIARQYAEIAVQRAETRAARLGEDLTGYEFAGMEVRQVLPETVAEAVKADSLDLVINAMRVGKDADIGIGDTLLSFIRKRGGINDPGGDLKSIGAPRGLIRAFDPDQGAFGGVSGAGDYGVDTTLSAAIEAGFFPELAGAAMKSGPSTIDTQVLLDAIGRELAGEPVYAEVREDRMRVAAADLREMLSEAGYDVDAMSDQDVRDAVEQVEAERAEGRGFEQSMPDTIDIDGVERSTVNSEGRPLANDEAGIRAFWKWFGDSKVVDAEGRPLVVYHGTNANAYSEGSFEAFNTNGERGGAFFSSDPQIAEAYGEERYDGYLSLQEPLIVFADGKGWASLDGNDRIEGDKKEPSRSKEDQELLDQLFNDLADISFDSVEVEQINEDTLGAMGVYSADIDAISKKARKLGYDGVIVRDVQDGPVSDSYQSVADTMIAFSPTQIKSINNRGTFDPADPRILLQEARGRIIFDQNKRIIELFQSRNLSTPIHEMGHMWLEELKFDASLDTAPEQVKADWQTVQNWFAASGFKVDGDIPTEAHELWARGIERYFMEGKSPTAALTRIFETVRSWMVNIYKTVKGLNSEIAPEVREVFDRMLATDEEIAAASEKQSLAALFKEAADIGMSEQDFAAYQEQVQAARADAHADLLNDTMRAVRRREQERYRDIRKAIRAEEEARIDASPLYRAIALMKEQRVSKQWIEEEMGADATALMPRLVPPLYADGGVDPNVIAELAGYAGARDMIEALIGAERAHRQAREGGDKRSMRVRAVETATDTEFDRRYGDALKDGTIEREALAALHSNAMGEVMAAELAVLARTTGKRATPYRLAREWARGKVRSGIVAQEAMPAAIQRYARNAAKAGKAAMEAMLAKDANEAFRQKQFQMLNNALLAEAKTALDDVEAAVKRMDKIARAKTRKSVDQDYLEQAQALLEAVDLRRRSQVGIDKQGQWEAWATARGAEGYDILTPPSFEATLGRTNWTRLSVENLLGLDEQVKQIMHLGRLKQTLLDNAERRALQEIVAEVNAVGDSIGRKPPRGSFTEPSWWETVKSGVATLDANLLKMEQVFDWLDDGKSNGAFNRIVFRPLADAQAAERDMLEVYYGKLKEARERIPEKTLRRMADRVTIDLIDRETGLPSEMERKKLVAMALNWGNAGNRQRLADGYGWSQDGIQRVLMEELSEPEWRFVQEVWDIIDGLWPEIERVEKAVNGVAPDRVEAVEVQTPFGSLRGGYYPAIYDTTLDYTAEEQAGKRADLFESAYTRATTRASATKDRAAKVSRPILLDPGVITRHVGEVIHDVTHREPVMNAHKFLTNRDVMRTVDDVLGPEVRKQFRPWLQHIANSWAQERAGNEGWGKFFGQLRANTTVVGMGWRFTTMLTQISGYSNGFEKVGAAWVAPEIAKFQAQMVAPAFKFVTFQGAEMPPMMAFALEKSKELKFRLDTLDRDIRREMDRMTAETTTEQAVDSLMAVKRFAFHGIGYMDRLVTVPLWTGAYNKALASGMTDAEAVFEADKAVRLSQGAGAPKDLAAISTGQGRAGMLLSYLTMFYSYVSAVYSRQRNFGRDVSRGQTALPSLVARAWWLFVVPPLLAELLSGRGPEEDEEAGWWAFKKMLSQSLGAIPVVRDVWEPSWDAIAGNKAFDYRMSPVQGAGQSIVNVSKDIGRIIADKDTKRATRNVLELTGYATGIPPGQIGATAQFLVDVGNGDADPDTAADWYTGLTKGRIEE